MLVTMNKTEQALLIVSVFLAVIILAILAFTNRFGVTRTGPQSFVIESGQLNQKNLQFFEDLYNVSNNQLNFINTTAYGELTGYLSDFKSYPENGYAVNEIRSDLTNKIVVGSSWADVSNIDINYPFHFLRLSSVFSLDFNLSFYDTDKSQFYFLGGNQAYGLDYQNILTNAGGNYIFADRLGLCYNFSSSTHVVRYSYFDLRSNGTAYDTRCTINLNSTESFTNYCMYPNKCTEVNILNYGDNTTNVIYYDKNNNVFFNRTFSLENPVFPTLNDVTHLLIANQNVCLDKSCSDFKAYLYSLKITAW